MEKTKEKAIEFVKNGGKCTYMFGLWNNGGNPISKEDALEKLSRKGWDFGMGFYELKWRKDDNGEDVLHFHEYSENDMW